MPRIESLEQYTLLVNSETSDVPASVAMRTAQIETKLVALKRPHEALRQFVISQLTPQQQTDIGGPMAQLPPTTMDNLPHSPANPIADVGINSCPPSANADLPMASPDSEATPGDVEMQGVKADSGIVLSRAEDGAAVMSLGNGEIHQDKYTWLLPPC